MTDPLSVTVHRRGPGHYETLLDGNPVAAFPNPEQARGEGEKIAFEEARRSDAPLQDAERIRQLLPQPDRTPDTRHIDAAYDHLCARFSVPGVRQRLERAHALALQWQTIATIDEAAGVVVITGRRRYKVLADPYQGLICSCPDFWPHRRQRIHMGLCKHVLAVEIYREAQLLCQQDDASISSPPAVAAPSLAPYTTFTLPGPALLALFGFARLLAPTTPLTLIAGACALAIEYDNAFASVPAQPDALAVVELDSADFAALWGSIRAHASQEPTITVTITATDLHLHGLVLEEAAPIRLLR